MNQNKLFIGNLHYSVTEEQLRNLFAPYGNLVSVKVMPGKGYGFIELETPEQAQKIKDTLSESVFQGRRLLIDGVPDKRSGTRTWASLSDQPHKQVRKQDGRINSDRRPRTEISSEPAEKVHHLVDVTKEYKKSDQTEQKPKKPAAQIGQYAAPLSHEKNQKIPTSGKNPNQTSPNKLDQERGDQQQRTFTQSPDQRKGPKYPGKQEGKNNKPNKGKPTAVKEKPPKNPHPYQGSKKSKTAQKPNHDSKQESPEPQEDERVSYLKYMASKAEKSN
jgi:RNA recognition motif-containing protein